MLSLNVFKVQVPNMLSKLEEVMLRQPQECRFDMQFFLLPSLGNPSL